MKKGTELHEEIQKIKNEIQNLDLDSSI